MNLRKVAIYAWLRGTLYAGQSAKLESFQATQHPDLADQHNKVSLSGSSKPAEAEASTQHPGTDYWRRVRVRVRGRVEWTRFRRTTKTPANIHCQGVSAPLFLWTARVTWLTVLMVLWPYFSLALPSMGTLEGGNITY